MGWFLVQRKIDGGSNQGPTFDLSDNDTLRRLGPDESSNGYSRMGIYDEYGEPKTLVREAFRNLKNPLKK